MSAYFTNKHNNQEDGNIDEEAGYRSIGFKANSVTLSVAKTKLLTETPLSIECPLSINGLLGIVGFLHHAGSHVSLFLL
jgi:hypothetical protein